MARKRYVLHCPDCGSEGGSIPELIVGVAYFMKARIGFASCVNCGGFWHKYAPDYLGKELPMSDRGGVDWAEAAAQVRDGRAFRR